MSNTGAERQRRYRAHSRGDHSLCDPRRCDGDTVTASSVTRHPPVGLAARGARLWRELTADRTPEPAERVLIEEACRIADRLDKLDAMLRGEEHEWLTLAGREDAVELTVVVDKALSEARQQAVALKQLLGELRAAQASARPTSRPTSRPKLAGAEPAREVSRGGVADLTARIRQRGTQTAG